MFKGTFMKHRSNGEAPCLTLSLVYSIFGSLLFYFITKIDAADRKKLGYLELLFLPKEIKSEAIKVYGSNGKKMVLRSLRIHDRLLGITQFIELFLIDVSGVRSMHDSNNVFHSVALRCLMILSLIHLLTRSFYFIRRVFQNKSHWWHWKSLEFRKK